MRILFLAQRVPYPPDRGDKIHTYNHLRHLAATHEVAVACLADGEEDLENIQGSGSLASHHRCRGCSPLARQGKGSGGTGRSNSLHRGVFQRT